MVDSNNNVIDSLESRLLLHWHWYIKQQDPDQLDGKQRHTGFDYYEHDIPKFVTPGWAQSSLDRSRPNSRRDLEDPEHDHARHQGINGHGRGQTYYKQRVRPVTYTTTVNNSRAWR